ncbi:2TM domain-containing protein [Flavobacterium sp. W22_SRS_FK3]|uniref:2TM domain-containing protein n=1 Tax=Flavobacterium sp. W22_SRS_FK3 TaxID=3240275 RepID=UPI003F9047C5
MERNCNKAREKIEFEEIFSKKATKLKSFYSHAFIYAIGLIVYVLKEYFGAPLNFFPIQYINCVVMLIWSSVFLFSAIDLFVSYKIFDEKWEARKMKSILEKKATTYKWE